MLIIEILSRVRNFDRNYFKPLLLREKAKSKDEKLLSTFKKINELNVNKMAENPDFVVTPVRALSIDMSSMM